MWKPPGVSPSIWEDASKLGCLLTHGHLQMTPIRHCLQGLQETNHTAGQGSGVASGTRCQHLSSICTSPGQHACAPEAARRTGWGFLWPQDTEALVYAAVNSQTKTPKPLPGGRASRASRCTLLSGGVIWRGAGGRVECLGILQDCPRIGRRDKGPESPFLLVFTIL